MKLFRVMFEDFFSSAHLYIICIIQIEVWNFWRFNSLDNNVQNWYESDPLVTSMLAGFSIHWQYPLCRGLRPQPCKRSVLGMTQNYIWWWGSSFGNLSSVKHPSLLLLSGPTWPRVVVPVRALSMGQIDLFKMICI